MTTIATLLSGGEGVGVGARAAGLHHLWGIEINDDVAQVARDNGFSVITADIMKIDPNTLERPDILHASPECQNASNAKHDPDASSLQEKETRLDVEIAGCIVRYLEVLQPRVFTLENVYGYRRFQAFRMIMIALARLGYFSDVQHLNAADFGVPQTRKRLILRAVHGGAGTHVARTRAVGGLVSGYRGPDPHAARKRVCTVADGEITRIGSYISNAWCKC